MRGPVIGLVVAAMGADAHAAEQTPRPAPDATPTVSELIVTASKTVSELTVTAKLKCLPPEKGSERATRPRIVSSFPGKGAVVRPGLLVVRLTFDQPMACDGALTDAPALENPCPGARQMLLSLDRKTIRTVCLVQPGHQYGLWVSQDPTFQSFTGLAGLPSLGYRLTFSTSNEAAVDSICAAMLQDEDTALVMRARGKADCAATP